MADSNGLLSKKSRMFKLKLTLIFLSIGGPIFSQDFAAYIREQAMPVHKDCGLDSAVYKRIQSYSLLMVGEMHGTQEPSMLVKELSKLIVNEENEVSIGLEIAADEMISFTLAPSDSTLRLTRFFTKESTDGRNNTAWFDLTSYCISEPRVNLFYFANHKSMGIQPNDSAMYVTVREQKMDTTIKLTTQGRCKLTT
jgi:hypothetical protein